MEDGEDGVWDLVEQMEDTEEGDASLPSDPFPYSTNALASLTYDQKLLIAGRFCPVFWLMADDQYRPVAYEEHLQHCSLWFENEEILKQGQVTPKSLLEHASVRDVEDKHQHDLRYHLKCDPKHHYGPPISQLDTRSPVYCHLRESELVGESVLSVTYNTFYSYNGAYKVVNKLMGGHEADSEHCTIHLTHRGPGFETFEQFFENLVIHSVWFNSHRARDGILRPAANLTFLDEPYRRTVEVFVARNGHGTYPEPGKVYRIFGFANDHCDRGVKWTPRCVLMPEPTDVQKVEELGMEWLWYPGRWGTSYRPYGHASEEELANPGAIEAPGNCPAGPAFKSWWFSEVCKTRSAIKRAVMPWAP